MKRKLMLVVIGASFLVPMNADAQRPRERTRVATRPAPIVTSGRLANCRAPARGASFDCRSRVVYSSHDRYDRAPNHFSRRGGLWLRADWRHVRLNRIRGRVHYGALGPGHLEDVLGRNTVRRLRDAGHDMGLRGRLEGHWEDGAGRRAVLVVTMGRVEVAEFVDFNGDGLVDEVFLARRGRAQVVSRW